MKSHKIRLLEVSGDPPDLSEVSSLLDKLAAREPVSEVNWSGYSNTPEVSFATARSSSELFIKFYVRERYMAALRTMDNQMVCNDSCVEFFAGVPGTSGYYNFEFNSIGTCYMGFGTGRVDSSPVDQATVKRIRRLSTIDSGPFPEIEGDHYWELTVAIPLDLFVGESEIEKGMKLRANFYKCGDELTEPHYLTWNRVETPRPDYHRPEFFGELVFE